MSQPTCQVCFTPYDPKDHRPLLLPTCGHTFCAFCLGCLHSQGKTSCPKCRKDGAVKPVSSLPVNYSLLDIAEGSACKSDASAEPNSASPPWAAGASRSQVPTPHSGLGNHTDLDGAEVLLDGSSRFPLPSNFLSSLRPASLHPQTPTLHTVGHINQVKFNSLEAAITASYPNASRSQFHQSRLREKQLQKRARTLFKHDANASLAASPCQPSPAIENSQPATFSCSSYMTASPQFARTQDAHNSASAILTVLEKEQQDELDFQMAVHLTFCKDSSHDHDHHTSCSSWCWENPR
ncbi:uncharacterized protein LOC135104899 [Scylla paramamosain]|uniref:uncharacterized protein LOC135104899 n=1 Tax=Scylla paramamosain TaxID=85552 RepID=UPI003082E411